jgi:hypothetical protein
MTQSNVYAWTLREEIINRSPGAVNFEEALEQWRVICTVKQGMTDCLCSYKNITNINVAVNIITNELVNIGSCCVKKFNINIDDKAKLKCCECNKPLPFTNKYVRSLYDNGVRMNKKTRIIGHDKCTTLIKNRYADLINTLERESSTGNIRNSTHNMIVNFVNYFGGIIKYAGINSSCELELEYEDKYDKYLQLLNIIST